MEYVAEQGEVLKVFQVFQDANKQIIPQATAPVVVIYDELVTYATVNMTGAYGDSVWYASIPLPSDLYGRVLMRFQYLNEVSAPVESYDTVLIRQSSLLDEYTGHGE